MQNEKAKSSVQVIERMMSLLDALAGHDTPVSLKQLSEESRLHASTAHRILNVMVQNRVADRIAPGTYRLGMRLLELGTLVRMRVSIRHEALPHMHQLHQQLGETVNLALRSGDRVVYVEYLSSGNHVPRIIHGGAGHVPLHITAAGKVFLAAGDNETCTAYIRRCGLAKFTDNTLTEEAGLLSDIGQAREHGYAFDQEEAERGTCCVGAGIYDATGKIVAGLSVSAPAERFDKGWAPHVKQTAQRISRALGNRFD